VNRWLAKRSGRLKVFGGEAVERENYLRGIGYGTADGIASVFKLVDWHSESELSGCA